MQREGADPRVWPADLIVPSDRSFKADQIERLGYAPEVDLLRRLAQRALRAVVRRGEDRAQGLQPRDDQRQARGRLGVRPLPPRPLAADQAPLDLGHPASTFSDRQLEAGLIQDPRLNKYFPDDLLREQGEALPQTPDEGAEEPPWLRLALRPRRHGPVELPRQEAGRRLDPRARAGEVHRQDPEEGRRRRPGRRRRRDHSAAADAGAHVLRGHARLPQRASAWPPSSSPCRSSPRLLEALVEAGRQKAYPSFLAYVDSLHEKYDFEFIDLTRDRDLRRRPDGLLRRRPHEVRQLAPGDRQAHARPTRSSSRSRAATAGPAAQPPAEPS